MDNGSIKVAPRASASQRWLCSATSLARFRWSILDYPGLGKAKFRSSVNFQCSHGWASGLRSTTCFPHWTCLNRSYNPAYYATRHPQQKGRATMKNLWIVGVASLALSTSAMGQPVIGPPFQSGPVCHPVASWTNVNSDVCIKYVCEGGGFHIQCLPAPPLEGPGPVR